MANKCPKCGFEYGEFDIFCARCGAKIASDDIAIKNIIKEEMDKKQEEDSKAVLNSVKKDGFSKRVEFLCDSSLIILKGSIAINGVSLTVSKVFEYGFEVSLIPSTIENTNLKNLKIGDIVNIEYDILGKYIKKFLKDNEKPKLTLEFLRENGF